MASEKLLPIEVNVVSSAEGTHVAPGSALIFTNTGTTEQPVVTAVVGDSALAGNSTTEFRHETQNYIPRFTGYIVLIPNANNEVKVAKETSRDQYFEISPLPSTTIPNITTSALVYPVDKDFDYRISTKNLGGMSANAIRYSFALFETTGIESLVDGIQGSLMDQGGNELVSVFGSDTVTLTASNWLVPDPNNSIDVLVYEFNLLVASAFTCTYNLNETDGDGNVVVGGWSYTNTEAKSVSNSHPVTVKIPGAASGLFVQGTIVLTFPSVGTVELGVPDMKNWTYGPSGLGELSTRRSKVLPPVLKYGSTISYNQGKKKAELKKEIIRNKKMEESRSQVDNLVTSVERVLLSQEFTDKFIASIQNKLVSKDK